MREHITARARTKSHSTNSNNPVLVGAGADYAGRPRAAGAACGSGLDSSQTSVQTNDPNGFFIDSHALKVKRARFATLTAARLHKLERPTWAATFVGMTYAPGNDYNPRDISELIKQVRFWCERQGIECRYLWVAEMQKRGVIHYHLMVFHPKAIQFPKPDKQGWWPHGSTNRKTGVKYAVAYMAKYMSKGDTAKYPKGARTYGCGGLNGTAKLEMRWWKLPVWVRDQVKPSDAAKRAIGGFLMPETGELLASPWDVLLRGGRIFIKRKDFKNGRPC